MPDLTDNETAILDLERNWWKHAGAKDAVIRERFDVSPTRYYQVLGALLERPEALAYDPMLVRRLVRLRERRRAVRVG
jgi:hypothetical protein